MNTDHLPKFVIGIRIRGQEKSDLFDPKNLSLRVGTWVMVNTKQGNKLGVVASNKIKNFYKKGSLLQDNKVIRQATEEDFAEVEKKEAFEERSKQLCLQQIEDLDLPMNLSRVIFLKNTYF